MNTAAVDANEYIRRKDALVRVDHYWQVAYHSGWFEVASPLASAYKDIEAIPAADVRPVSVEEMLYGAKNQDEVLAKKVRLLWADLKDCRNELCLRCGSYRNAHNGACDGCRWKCVHD